MAHFSRLRYRIALLSCIILTLCFFCHNRVEKYRTPSGALSAQQWLSKHASASSNPLHNRLNLNEQDCRATFPLLFTTIDASIARGSFNFSRSPTDYQGLIQARIRNNVLYILTESPSLISQTLHQRTSTLSQIHRALLTSPSLLPNITFSFTTNDVPKNNSWGFARPNKHSNENIWIMPLFVGWSWPRVGIGSMDDTLRRIDDVENMGWDVKENKAIWRGTVWFNPLGYPNLRKNLIAVTKGHTEWANVAPLNATNALSIEDFCRYKYIVYTEGVTYSGRLPYHQACESVLIMAPLTWVTMSAMAIKPIWAGDLFRGSGVDIDVDRKRIVTPGLLAPVTSYREANAIFVEPDFSNMRSVIKFLRERPSVARRIAQNQRELIIGGRYLSNAAEVCSWRALIRGWSEAAKIDETEWGDSQGERYETWLLKR